jgi:hypothetical protein
MRRRECSQQPYLIPTTFLFHLLSIVLACRGVYAQVFSRSIKTSRGWWPEFKIDLFHTQVNIASHCARHTSRTFSQFTYNCSMTSCHEVCDHHSHSHRQQHSTRGRSQHKLHSPPGIAYKIDVKTWSSQSYALWGCHLIRFRVMSKSEKERRIWITPI